jgi:hypothetical protein
MLNILLISVLKRRFTGKITLIARRDMRQKICSLCGRQGITSRRNRFILPLGDIAVMLYVFSLWHASVLVNQ